MKLSIEIGVCSDIDKAKKERILKLLAKQDLKILEKLETLSKSSKAINYLNNNWLTLKLMLGI